MIDLAKTILPFALVFGAIALLSALALSRSCSVGIGRRVARPADPYRYPFRECERPAAGAFVASVQWRALHERDHEPPPIAPPFPSGSILDRDFGSVDEAGRRHRAF